MKTSFVHPKSAVLESRLREFPRRIQILSGPRQVGKTTLIQQLMAKRPSVSFRLIAADPFSLPTIRGLGELAAISSTLLTPPSPQWLEAEWQAASAQAEAWEQIRVRQNRPDQPHFVLVVDEVQNVPQWSGLIKGLWDAAQARALPMHLLLLGSAPLLIQQGLKESLAGRFELIRMAQWSFEEMNDAFGFTLEQYVHFGGYPGSAHLVGDEARWRSYIRDAIVEPSIGRDVLAMTRVDKPALLRQLFELGASYSAQILSLDKMSGQLGQGHTLTLAENLLRLSHAGLLSGLYKHAGQQVRQRASPPKFQVHDNALLTVMQSYGLDEARTDRSHWGRKIESIVGAHLLNTADTDTTVFYWRERDKEVDFIVLYRGKLAAIEVKQQSARAVHAGLDEFCRRYAGCRRWIVGGPDLPLGEFLKRPADYWTR